MKVKKMDYPRKLTRDTFKASEIGSANFVHILMSEMLYRIAIGSLMPLVIYTGLHPRSVLV